MRGIRWQVLRVLFDSRRCAFHGGDEAIISSGGRKGGTEADHCGGLAPLVALEGEDDASVGLITGPPPGTLAVYFDFRYSSDRLGVDGDDEVGSPADNRCRTVDRNRDPGSNSIL